MRMMLAPAPSIMREPLKYIVQYSSFSVTTGIWTSVHSAMKIDECLGFDGRSWLEGELEGAKLNRPLCNPSGGVAIVNDFTDREACDHRYGMRLEVMY